MCLILCMFFQQIVSKQSFLHVKQEVSQNQTSLSRNRDSLSTNKNTKKCVIEQVTYNCN